MIPRPFIDDLLTRTDIVEVIDSFVKLKRQGVNYVACCPFHQEKTPSFSVSPNKQIYHCFGCGVGGNAISFLMEYDNLHFVEAIEELARRAGVTVPKETSSAPTAHSSPSDHEALTQAARYYQQQLKAHPKADEAKQALKSRGLSGQTAKRFGLGFAPPGWDNLLKSNRQSDILQSWLRTGLIIRKDEHKTYDRFRHRIMFPIRDRRGRVIGFGGRVIDPNDTPKYLNSNESEVFHKSQTLYGIYELLQHQRRVESVLIVEGYMDVIMLAEHGIHNAVATLGTATTPQHIQALLRLSPNLTFCFDGDKAGQTAAWRALESSLKFLRDDSNIKFLFLPDGEDPDSMVCQEGREAFMQRVDQAIGLPEYFINHLSQTHDQSNMAGKSALLSTASDLLSAMPDIHLKGIIMDALAKRLLLPLERLPLLMQQSQKHAKTTPSQALNKIPSIVRRALALLLQHPQLHRYVPESLTMTHGVAETLWREINQTLSEQPNLTTAALVEKWRNNDHHSLVMQLANWQHPVPSDGIEQEFCGLMEHLSSRSSQQELDDLFSQAKIRQLSQAERQRLAELIQQKQIKNSEKNP